MSTKLLKTIFLTLIVFLLFNSAARGQDYYINDAYTAQLNSDIKTLNDKIKQAKDKINSFRAEQDKYKSSISDVQDQALSLANEITLLDNRVIKTQLDIDATQLEISMVDLQTKGIKMEIENTNIQIEKNNDHLRVLLKMINQEEKTSTLEILLLNNSLGEFLNQVKYLENINSAVGSGVDDLKKSREILVQKQAELDDKNKKLVTLKTDLENQQQTLEAQKEDKVYILEQTKSKESEYQRLIKLSKTEQDAAAREIADTEKEVRAKVASLSQKKLVFNDAGLIWPVPGRTITAYFHDPDYPFRYLFEHPAVDIRAPQGTPLAAAASGYVAIAKDAGYGYSYIMLVHGDGISTVYGHASKIYVKADEYVTQGQIIGLSGALPGTPGAGPFTTGPHLHFEVRLNGIPVNPLEYLPQ
jgi:murein DD-endopeptidase MepM/ murein hydrolase activator NlpD